MRWGANKNMLRQGIMAVAVVSCVPSADDTQAKFITIAQVRNGAAVGGTRDTGDGFLISKLGLRRWKIFYGFEDNNNCDGIIDEEFERKLKNTISRSLRAWVSPLSEVIVDGNPIGVPQLRYVKRSTEATDEDVVGNKAIHRMIFKNGEELKPTAMAVIFYCRRGRSFARRPYIHGHYFTRVHMFLGKFDEPYLRDTKQYPDGKIALLRRNYLRPFEEETDEGVFTSYSQAVLHHEIGHVFGLADTFVDLDRRPSDNTGGSQDTVGEQPISVMSHSRITALDDEGEFVLTADDREGIKWLYRYYTKNDEGSYGVELRDCPAGFLHESSTGGCAPENIILFELEHGTASSIEELMYEIQAEDLLFSAIRGGNLLALNNLLREMKEKYSPEQLREIITRSNSYRITPLHEAAWYGHAEVVALLPAHLDMAVNEKSAFGHTALMFAAMHGHAEVVALLLTHPNIAVSEEDTQGRTALMFALRGGHTEVVELLRE